MIKRKFRNRSFCMLEPDLIESEAFLSLSGKWTIIVLIRFHQKAHRKRLKSGKRKGQMVITNNGEIVFMYAEALELGISRSTFYRVIRELIEDKGFIDVVEPGNWYHKHSIKFAISERWKRYGTDQYQTVKLGRILPDGLGFQIGNYQGQDVEHDLPF